LVEKILSARDRLGRADATVNPPTAAFHTTRIIEELDEKRST
jgi:hypothetical protein